jgi:hypothetical protein
MSPHWPLFCNGKNTSDNILLTFENLTQCTDWYKAQTKYPKYWPHVLRAHSSWTCSDTYVLLRHWAKCDKKPWILRGCTVEKFQNWPLKHIPIYTPNYNNNKYFIYLWNCTACAVQCPEDILCICSKISSRRNFKPKWSSWAAWPSKS